MKICKNCGCKINEADGDMAFTVNPGLPNEYVECESCHDSSWEAGRIVNCEACGEWFSPDSLHDEEVAGESFCACPSCGKDMIEGMTKEEFVEEHFVPKYAAVVFFGGMTRGYQISAHDSTKAMEKLMGRLKKSGMNGVTAVYISEILLDEDVM